MQTLGLTQVGRNITLAIFHADRTGLPNVHHDEFDSPARMKHRAALDAASARVGDGSLRPGKQCLRCPAENTCPARAAELLEGASRSFEALTTTGPGALTATGGTASLSESARDGRLYSLLRAFRKLDEAATAELRRKVEAGSLVELPDGTTLTIQTQEYETLSKSSIVRQLGRLEGERLVESLRKRGVVEKATRKMLHAEKGR